MKELAPSINLCSVYLSSFWMERSTVLLLRRKEKQGPYSCDYCNLIEMFP